MKLNMHENIAQRNKDWSKVQDVWDGCKTPEQRTVALRMMELYLRKAYPDYKPLTERWYMPIVTLTLTSALCGLVFIMATGGF